MSKRFLTDQAKQALLGSIKAVEGRSSAEVVIAVRARAASYLHVDLIVGMIAGLAALTFILYSSYEFPVWSILVDPILFGVVLGFAGSRIPVLRRLLTPRKVREAWVARDARATFCEKRVRMTRDRTGILIYVALTERRLEVIADTGVEAAVHPDSWRKALAPIAAAVARGEDGVAVAAEITRLGDVLEPVLERSPDDVNELPDEVCG